MRALSNRTLLFRCCTLVILASACSTALAGKVYQWKDAKGVTHFSDSPPPAGQKVQDRRIDNRGEPILESAAKVADSPQCTTAKLNVSILSGGSDVQQDTDGDGKPDKILGQDDRANQRTLAEAAVKAYCTPVASAGR